VLDAGKMAARGGTDVGKAVATGMEDVGEDVRGTVSIGGVVVPIALDVGKVDVAGWACCADIVIPLRSWAG